MKAKVVYRASDHDLMVGIVLINTTEEKITLLTEPDSKAIARGADGILIVQAGFGGKKRMLGHELVPSLSPYHPVTLSPGEATGFHMKLTPSTIDVEDGEAVHVQYSIGETLTKKYELWHAPIKEASTSLSVIGTPKQSTANKAE